MIVVVSINCREERLGAKQVIRVHNSDLTITSLKDSNIHRFQYDHCFWSFDDIQASFADQKTVYNEIARPLLDKAFEGYNTCLFAYGQVRSLLHVHVHTFKRCSECTYNMLLFYSLLLLFF